jgi:hypothetical protein
MYKVLIENGGRAIKYTSQFTVEIPEKRERRAT